MNHGHTAPKKRVTYHRIIAVSILHHDEHDETAYQSGAADGKQSSLDNVRIISPSLSL
jgi:hypothetical protein